MIQAISKRMTRYMFHNQMNQESFEIHQYGIEVILSTFVNIIIILILGLSFKRVNESIIYILGFYIIRKFCGGYHCQTYAKCIGLHVLLFIIYLLTYTYYQPISLYISMSALIVFMLYAPVKNRDITINQQKQYKKISLIILLGYILLAYITPYTTIMTYIMLIVSILIVACTTNYEKNIT